MAILPTHVDRHSDQFGARTAEMADLIALLAERRATIAAGGSEAARAKHAGRGKLLARERIDRLVDPDGAFLELGALAAWDQYDGVVPSAGIITGIGVVEGRACVIVANDATVKGGTYYPTDGQEASASAGGRAREPAAVHLPRRLGRRFSAACRPTSFPTAITSAASSTTRRSMSRSWHPADRRGDGLVHRRWRLCARDERRDDHRQGHRHDLPRRPAVGEGRDRRDGDRRRARRQLTSTRVSPALPTTMRSRRRATRIGTRAPYRGHSRACARPRPGSVDCCRRRAPNDAADELYGVVPVDTRVPYDVREVIASHRRRQSNFDEFKHHYGDHDCVCGFGPHLRAIRLAILANNGVLVSAESALKGAHFIELCRPARHCHCVFLQNITGFMVGTRRRARRHRQATAPSW